MKKGYWIVAYRSVSDESMVKAYGALAGPAIESLGGPLLTRSASQVQAHEAGLQQRTVVVEFDSYEVALAAYESEALQALASGAERDFRIVEVRKIIEYRICIDKAIESPIGIDRAFVGGLSTSTKSPRHSTELGWALECRLVRPQSAAKSRDSASLFGFSILCVQK